MSAHRARSVVANWSRADGVGDEESSVGEKPAPVGLNIRIDPQTSMRAARSARASTGQWRAPQMRLAAEELARAASHSLRHVRSADATQLISYMVHRIGPALQQCRYIAQGGAGADESVRSTIVLAVEHICPDRL